MNRSWVLGLYPWWCDGFCFVWDGTRHVPMVGNRCMVFHVLLTDITLDHAQRISIDPGEAAAWGSRTKFIYDNRFQTPELFSISILINMTWCHSIYLCMYRGRIYMGAFEQLVPLRIKAFVHVSTWGNVSQYQSFHFCVTWGDTSQHQSFHFSLNEPEILLWCFNMYRGNNFEQLGATLVISGIFIGCLRYYGALIG